MLEGTKKLFPTDYDRFKEAMVSAAEANDLPVALQLDDIKDYTLRDYQDLFADFTLETSLEMEGSFFLCRDCGKLHLRLVINCLKREEKHILQ